MKRNIKSIIICSIVTFLLLLSVFSVPENNSDTTVLYDTVGDNYASKTLISDTELSIPDMVEEVSLVQSKNISVPISESEYINEKGELEVPFDVAFPERFESGEVEYSSDTIMIKFHKPFDGKVNNELKQAGVAKLDLMFELDDSAWYIASLSNNADVVKTMSAVREADQVIIAEYDFIVETGEYHGSHSNNHRKFGRDVEYFHDKIKKNRHHHKQWYLLCCGIHHIWDKPLKNDNQDMTGKGTIVAVIDTGVDYDHEDLAANMWKNTGEIPDNGVDDDNNGYIDDYYGVDVIAGKGNGDDDHGHGTHVAGIIGAVNNEEGIAGIAYNAKIMSVKAGQYSGIFNQSDIAEAIIYAYENGADVINMSFGSTSTTTYIQDALTLAYNRCVLVASAGNEGHSNEVYPVYPAAFTYVLGVMSIGESGMESSFSNVDEIAFNNVEYELYAPGENIYSTIPNNQYGNKSGTSMAAPVVSGIAANLRSAYPDRFAYPTKYIYGQLAATSNILAECRHGVDHNLPMVVDADSAYEKQPIPNVSFCDYTYFDSIGLEYDSVGVNNGDGVIDSGETIALGFVLRNQWGMAEDCTVTLDCLSEAGLADPNVLINGKTSETINYGSVGTYSEKDCGKIYTDGAFTGWENPFYVTINNDCPNDTTIKLNVTVTAKNALDEDDETVYSSSSCVYLSVRNGTILPNRITEDTIWTADHNYIIPNQMIIEDDVTVTVEPGVQIQFWSEDNNGPYAEEQDAFLEVQGNLYFEGNEEEHITLFPCESVSDGRVEIYSKNNGYISMKYCDVSKGIISVDYAYGSYFYDKSQIGVGLACYCACYDVSSAGGKWMNSIFVDSSTLGYGHNNVYYGNNSYKNGIYNGSKAKFTIPMNLFIDYTYLYPDFNYLTTYNETDYYSISFSSPSNSSVKSNFVTYVGATVAVADSDEEALILEKYSDKFVIEFPKGTCPFSTDAEFLKILDQFFTSGEHGYFTNNVILNRTELQTADKYWLLFEVPVINGANDNIVGFGGNYWGTTDLDLIEKQIIDHNDYATYPDLDPTPILTEAPSDVWPFVVDAGIMDAEGNTLDSVGNSAVTFYVDFNRDMDTTIPLRVRFGSYYPYADYEVDGVWIDERRWEGVYQFDTLIENGTQYFNISNGQAEKMDDEPTMKLFADWGRFPFEIDTTEAFVMMMQAASVPDGVKLSWYQDDYETLDGYNIYRSTSETGQYYRINSHIIPKDVKEYIDTTVEPGVRYYYNFTVVKTDLTESKPSGRVSVTVGDVFAPDIYHTPVMESVTNADLVISALVRDNYSVDNVLLYWRIVGESEYRNMTMINVNDKYSATIPKEYITTEGIEYYIVASDGGNSSNRGTSDAPYCVVISEYDMEYLLGDVDGDGKISSKDAIMLLQSINNMVNLEPDKFKCADIDGNETLETQDVLRILYYVNGKTTVLMPERIGGE